MQNSVLLLAILGLYFCGASYFGGGITFSKYLPGYLIRRFWSISLLDCGSQCLRRPRCDFINYHRLKKECELNEHLSTFNKYLLEKRTGYMFALRSDWENTLDIPVCSGCRQQQTCEQLGSALTCSINECDIPLALNNSFIHGNNLHIGSLIKYECEPEFTFAGNQSQITCLANGTWSQTELTCIAAPGCGPEWVQYNESCVIKIEENMDQASAWNNCISLGGDLVKIMDHKKNEFIKGVLYTGENGDNYWIGLKVTSGQLLWSDGTIGTYTPPDGVSQVLYTDPCVVFTDYSLEWWHYPCSRKKPSLCEIQVTSGYR